MDSVCDGSSGCRDDILYLCASAAGDDDLYRTDLRHLRMETEPYMDQDEKITDALWAGQIGKCTAVVLSVASTGISDLQEYGSRIFSGWRRQIRIL